MSRTTAIVIVASIGVSLSLGLGLAYLSVTDSGMTKASTPDASVAATTSSTNVTETSTTTASMERPPGTPLVQSDRVLNSSYDDSDGSLMVKFTATGDDWAVNIYRSGTSLTTLTPEEYTDENGNTHPTTSYWNQNATLPKSKSYAFIGSRIEGGESTTTTSDDEYVVTVVLPSVVSENVRFTLVEGERATTFFEGEY